MRYRHIHARYSVFLRQYLYCCTSTCVFVLLYLVLLYQTHSRQVLSFLALLVTKVRKRRCCYNSTNTDAAKPLLVEMRVKLGEAFDRNAS
jgi:hypothetical protein